ncbi:MAG: acyl-CoA dehydrogenase family protein [Alphaproteobacteria bacterium]
MRPLTRKSGCKGKSPANGERVAIGEHPDVKRMLLTMRAKICAARALTYEAAMALDKAQAGDEAAQLEAGLLTPLVKGWGTDLAVEVASTGIQVFGGMGFIEETGAAQFYRDARILPIYEGTNGIQALDLVFRKLVQDQGQAARAYIEKMESRVEGDEVCLTALSALRQATDTLSSYIAGGRAEAAAFVASPYMTGFAQIAGGALLVSSARAAKENECGTLSTAYEELTVFYRAHLLPIAVARLSALTHQI